MDYRDYKVYCIKDIDVIATKEKSLDEIMNFYRKIFEEDVSINEIEEIKDRDDDFMLINEGTNYKEVTTYNKLIKEYIRILDEDAEYLYLCSKEW